MRGDDQQRPALSRRREVSDTSARSVLMTVLGEFVLPREGPVWTATLLRALAVFEIEEKSARQALARSASEGWLVSNRVGRRVHWSLTEPGRRLLTEGAQRIYAFGREQWKWDGRWLLLLVSVPESQRELRHRVRTRLHWAGFGSPASGVWVSPHTEQHDAARQILTEAGLDDSAMSFVADYGRIGDVESLVARAWDLSAVTERYEGFIDEFTGLGPGDDASAFTAQTKMVHEWRRFPFLDPQLPTRLLPSGWSGTKAADLFHHNHDQWHPMAQRHWDRLLEEADPTTRTP